MNAIVAFLNSSYTVIDEDDKCKILKPCSVADHIMQSPVILEERLIGRIVDFLREYSAEKW